MAQGLTETQYNIIKRIAQTNGFKEYKLEEYSISSKGDNYLGQILCVTIKDNSKTLDIVVKKAPVNDEFRKAFPVVRIFYREIFLYENVLKNFVEFQKKNDFDHSFASFPKLYASSKEEYSECLIMENLIKNGYKHWNRKLPMNFDHIALVMTEYGKLHAVSFAMKKKNPKLFEELCALLTKEEEASWQEQDTIEFLKNTCAGLKKAVVGNPVLESAYERLVLNVDKYFMEEALEPKEKKVITHGDAWCNNMLFKYDDPNDVSKPTKISLIDWQMSKCAPPLQDLIHFFYASSSKETMDDYKKYLRIYHDSLSRNLRKMSCNPEELFPFEDLESLWKKFGKYGLLIAGFVYRILYVDSQNVPEIQTEAKSMGEFFDQFGGMGDSDQVKERIVDLFTHMIENDFV